jgi:hypothetical protein
MATNQQDRFGVWQPIERAPEWLRSWEWKPKIGQLIATVLTDTDGSLIVLWYDQDEARVTKFARLRQPEC